MCVCVFASVSVWVTSCAGGSESLSRTPQQRETSLRNKLKMIYKYHMFLRSERNRCETCDTEQMSENMKTARERWRPKGPWGSVLLIQCDSQFGEKDNLYLFD